MTERPPDLTTLKPLDIWILKPGEEPPPGSGVTVTDDGVRVAFRPHKEKEHEPTARPTTIH